MNRVIVHADVGITVAGSAAFSKASLAQARLFAPRLVAADGGADRLLRLGAEPEAVIGDLDSVTAPTRLRLGEAKMFEIAEQSTTDFDKVMRSISAPFVIGVGFLGGRLDHSLAVLNGLIRHADRRCLIIGPDDLTFAAPAHIVLDLPKGSRLSLFPMRPVHGVSEGLVWPIAGLDFSPDAMIGTSNRVSQGPVRLEFDTSGMLITLPLRALSAALRALHVL